MDILILRMSAKGIEIVTEKKKVGILIIFDFKILKEKD